VIKDGLSFGGVVIETPYIHKWTNTHLVSLYKAQVHLKCTDYAFSTSQYVLWKNGVCYKRLVSWRGLVLIQGINGMV